MISSCNRFYKLSCLILAQKQLRVTHIALLLHHLSNVGLFIVYSWALLIEWIYFATSKSIHNEGWAILKSCTIYFSGETRRYLLSSSFRFQTSHNLPYLVDLHQRTTEAIYSLVKVYGATSKQINNN